MARTSEERRVAELSVAKSHARFYKREAEKDVEYQWLFEKWQAAVETLEVVAH